MDEKSNEPIPTSPLISRLKREIDELAVQLELGKSDAVDFVEKHKEALRDVVGDVRKAIDEGRVAAGEQTSSLKQQLDELRLMLALGRMETRDALDEQRGKIHAAIDAAKCKLDPVEASLKEHLTDTGESLKTKLDALALDLGIRKTVAEDELAKTKDQFKADLKGIKRTLQPAIDGVGESLEDIGRQAHDKFSDLKDRLNQLFD